MRRTLSFAAALLLLVAAVFLLRTPRISAQQPAPSPQATCTFTNPGFSGKCVQNVPLPQGTTPGSACRDVLSCLNNSTCLKTYCQATTIRSGWKLESAAPAR